MNSPYSKEKGNQENHVSKKKVRSIDHIVHRGDQENHVSKKNVRSIDHIVSQEKREILNKTKEVEEEE